ncbi:hypothetical protein D9613_008206 [Agrocybe pediades]|uniref:Uncharacterized protein n=1 Tax=Agrocybe pediades TaxID=84607 RepID=A0A8H4QMS1_9AGAR|nr:hypothetical protein D9613_008206 [Agrocybe pediades]
MDDTEDEIRRDADHDDDNPPLHPSAPPIPSPLSSLLSLHAPSVWFAAAPEIQNWNLGSGADLTPLSSLLPLFFSTPLPLLHQSLPPIQQRSSNDPATGAARTMQ